MRTRYSPSGVPFKFSDNGLPINNRRITGRKLVIKYSLTGPKHDPYEVRKFSVELSYLAEAGAVPLPITRTYELVMDSLSLEETLTINGDVVDGGYWSTSEGARVERNFHTLTGIEVSQFEELYNRAHPYFDDPISRYGGA